MNDIKLTKKTLEAKDYCCRDREERDRIQAILLRSEYALRIHEPTVSRHIEDYAKSKLSSENGGTASLVNENQTVELISEFSQTYKTQTVIVEILIAGLSIL